MDTNHCLPHFGGSGAALVKPTKRETPISFTTMAGMLVTPDASVEPSPPKLDVGFVVWHPRYWDLHVWPDEGGVPTVTFANPRARPGGLSLPDEAFFRLVNGRRERISKPR